MAGNLVRIFEEVPEIRRLLLHTNLLLSGLTVVYSRFGFRYGVTTMKELWKYTIKIIVGPMSNQNGAPSTNDQDIDVLTLEDFFFDRGRVSAMGWLMNIILGHGK
jgi:hypothetical protein